MGLELSPEEYPHVTRDENMAEDLHGQTVMDPYRYLEDPDSEKTQQFVASQNSLTQKLLKQCTSRAKFQDLMRDLYNYPRYSCPQKEGKRYFWTYNSGLQAQAILQTQADLNEDPRILLDPNKLSDDGTVAFMSKSFTEDGSIMAYSLSSGGSDWRTIHFMTIAEDGSATELADKLENVKFSSMAWTHDGKGLFYNTYPKKAGAQPGALGTETDTNINQRLSFHVLGTAQEEDPVILAVPDCPEWMIGAQVTDDGSYLLLSISNGCQRQLPIQKFIDSFEASFSYVANIGTELILHTNLKAPRYRVIKVNLAQSDGPQGFLDVVPQHPRDLLQWAFALQGDNMVCCFLRDVHHVLQLHALTQDKLLQDIPLPGLGSIVSFSGNRKNLEFFFKFASFIEPGVIYRAELKSDTLLPTVFRRSLVKGFQPEDFEVRQEFAESKDGTKVPMFIFGKKSIQQNSRNPLLLYGYGGFNISLEPSFSVGRICFILAYGGIVVSTNLRGGGEYGLDWRAAGSMHNKQNVFDDFQACAEHVISQKYTCASKIISQGGSNGGLLVAACANQRPDLFGCVLAQVGVMDMLRFHLFTIGHAWMTDYGNPGKREDFELLYSYSPLHNVRQPREGIQYPAMLLLTGDHDDRVSPLHSLKLLAELQYSLTSTPGADQKNPLVARIEVRTGHGAGKPTEKVIAEAADMFAFAAEATSTDWIHCL
ncbi:hypothetical protein WJX74_002405 [Apatococcus lobatus]|uniref:Prolyl endopeptidase n=1 Tax=Apatococcus lobatus TaxID=904363 RepID=A0AAW1RI67_9CHLO